MGQYFSYRQVTLDGADDTIDESSRHPSDRTDAVRESHETFAADAPTDDPEVLCGEYQYGYSGQSVSATAIQYNCHNPFVRRLKVRGSHLC